MHQDRGEQGQGYKRVRGVVRALVLPLRYVQGSYLQCKPPFGKPILQQPITAQHPLQTRSRLRMKKAMTWERLDSVVTGNCDCPSFLQLVKDKNNGLSTEMIHVRSVSTYVACST